MNAETWADAWEAANGPFDSQRERGIAIEAWNAGCATAKEQAAGVVDNYLTWESNPSGIIAEKIRAMEPGE